MFWKVFLKFKKNWNIQNFQILKTSPSLSKGHEGHDKLSWKDHLLY